MGLTGCNGVVRFLVVEQLIPPVIPVGLMRGHCVHDLDLDKDGDNVGFGGEPDLRTLESVHTVVRADHFATGGWCPPPEILSRHEKTDGSDCAYQNSYHHQSRTTQGSAQDQRAHDDQTDTPSNAMRQTTFAQDFRTPTLRSVRNWIQELSADVRHGRPHVHPEPERARMPEGSIAGRINQSLTVPENEHRARRRKQRRTGCPSLGPSDPCNWTR